MPKVTVDNSRGLVQEGGTGLIVNSVTELVGATTITGALTANSTSNDIALSLRVVIGDRVTLGTADDGSDSSIVALDADAIYSNATAGMANGAFLTSFNGGPTAEAGTAANGAGLALVANAVVFTTTERYLYFMTTSSSGNPTAGKYKPILFVMRLA